MLTKKINLFISHPGDIKDEIDCIQSCVKEINKIQNEYILECLDGTFDTYTEVGEYPQEVISKQIGPKYDILVGIFWQRIGTPTKKEKSGTIEEIKGAISKKKQLLVYFNISCPQNLNQIDLGQLKEIRLFKEELSQAKLLYKEFESIENFSSMFRIQLMNLIKDKFLIKSEVSKLNLNKVSIHSTIDKYNLISNLITDVEQKNNGSSNKIDGFKLIEEIKFSLDIVISCMQSMAISVSTLNEKLENRTTELNSSAKIKDNKLRISKSDIIVNLIAEELDEFNNRIEQELSKFSENLLFIGPAYSKIILFISDYDIVELDTLKQVALEFRNSIEKTTNSSASLLKIVINWPSFNSKFNKSKRETEITLKNLTKELLEGLKLLDEAIQ